MWVGSFKIWGSPCWDVKMSSLASSGAVLSVEHHLLNLAFKVRLSSSKKKLFLFDSMKAL